MAAAAALVEAPFWARSRCGMEADYPLFENPLCSELKHICKRIKETYKEIKEDLTPYKDDRYYR